ncbi:MAG: mannose/fructose/sorbose PTS transporter subunit IIB [Selenomonadaceae bacterium]|jgi:PTS system mannose-specific IIB component
MKISFVRIDDRLIHGQVATVWVKAYDCNRIMCCSDEVAKDELRKQLVLQVTPPGIKAYILPIQKAIEAFNNPQYNSFTTFFLFTNPTDVLRMVDAGIPFKNVNLGGMRYIDGKTQISQAVSVNAQDVASLKKLDEKGIKLELRQLVKDPKTNVIEKLKSMNLL